ncbi:hypothetical protein [Frondihabitans sucicola]|uniref:hypothetical protein n=1 Tax=Frondihabitans sucicola TaxID=1268041 RepID=UPI002573E27E|nr:hypothetical protein [Frondihabitans sucicola]
MLRLLQPPLRRLLVLVLIAAAVIGGIVWYFGLAVPGAVLVAVAVAAVGSTWIAVQEADAVEWPTKPAHRSPGARRDVETLSWSMKTRGGVHEKTLARAREAARHRLLFLYGLDLYDPANRDEIERLLAPGVVRVLLTPRHSNLDLVSFTRLLGALEALGAPTERPS